VGEDVSGGIDVGGEVGRDVGVAVGDGIGGDVVGGDDICRAVGMSVLCVFCTDGPGVVTVLIVGFHDGLGVGIKVGNSV